jgi:hypothetical protein
LAKNIAAAKGGIGDDLKKKEGSFAKEIGDVRGEALRGCDFFSFVFCGLQRRFEL